MPTFIPRGVFPGLSTLTVPRSYFLGHHSAGLDKMRSLLGSIDLVIECRDYRTPLTSRNPLFEQFLGERPRLIVHTKRDLGSTGSPQDKERERTISKWSQPTPTLFASTTAQSTIHSVLLFCRQHVASIPSHLFGTRLLVVGMPNVGKSSLLNALRNTSLHRKKAARTGDQPGVTRKVSTAVKIIESDEPGEAGNVYVLDTPGVFVPYIPDAESMLKLALCGNVKDTIVPPETIADYLLYHINLHAPESYESWCEPTNEIMALLDALARKQGRLKKGGEPDYDAAALQFIQKWRAGELGRFVLDDVSDEALIQRERMLEGMGGSWNQARRSIKMERKLKMGRTS